MKKQKTWENLEVGDVLENGVLMKTVLGIAGKVIFISANRSKIEYDSTWTIEELIHAGYTIVQDKEEEVNKEEDLKKLIEETQSLIQGLLDKYVFYLSIQEGSDIKNLLAKWKGVEVEKIKYIK